MFFMHLLLQWILMSGESFGNYGILGRVIFGLVFLIWFYWFFCYLYYRLKKRSVINNYVLSIITAAVLYVTFRIPDIIDGDFIKDFRFLMFVIFLSSAFVLEHLSNGTFKR